MSQRHTGYGAITEKAFQQQVVMLASLLGWKIYHPYLSVRSAPGFPDLTLAKPGRPILFAELKSATGRLTVDQESWLEVLRHATGCQVYVWRPGDWDSIEQVLRS